MTVLVSTPDASANTPFDSNSPATQEEADPLGGTLGAAIGRLGAHISETRIGTQGIAELRRALHAEVPGPTFWRVLYEDVVRHNTIVTPQQEDDWALIIGGMATMAPNHHTHVGFGRALANAELPESRLRTLLSTDPGTPRFRDALFASVIWLARKTQAVNWRDIASLILTRDPDKLTSLRRHIAREYFAHISA